MRYISFGHEIYFIVFFPFKIAGAYEKSAYKSVLIQTLNVPDPSYNTVSLNLLRVLIRS
jgi:hypothetical protein